MEFIGPLPQLVFRFPGTWWPIPLDDREKARTSIRELVRRQVGAADDRAALRNELQRHLLAALEESIDGDGQSFHIALEIIPRIPIPVAVSVTLPQQAITPAVGTEPQAVMAVLARGIEETQGDAWSTAHQFVTKQSAVLRIHRRFGVDGKPFDPQDFHPEQLPAHDQDDVLDVLAAQYWITIPGTKRFAMVTCSTAYGPLEETMLKFFDSLIRASFWHTPSPPVAVD